MKSKWLALFALLTCGVLVSPVIAQDEHASPENDAGIQMIARTTQAIDYRRGDQTEVGITGTNLSPDVTGNAKIINKRGLTDIHVDVQNLRSSNALDASYLTYVLWAISPEGIAKNIGELVEKNGKASVHTTTNLQAFALVITAEPDFAVTQPSELVVAENTLKLKTKGVPQSINVHYQVLPRSLYLSQGTAAAADIFRDSKNAPLDLLEGRNAVRIAESSHAAQYAPDALGRAKSLLQQAEDAFNSHRSDRSVETAARSAVQSAEEARALGVRGEYQARMERQRREAQERAENAQTQAQSAQEQAQRAEAQRRAAEQQANDERERAEQARKQAQADEEQRRQLEAQHQAAQQQAQQAQQEAELQRQQAQQAQQQAQTEAQQRAAAEQQAQVAQQRAQQAETQQQQLRDQLRQQLNQILETRDTARGLIVSMPDVLFDTGSATLKPTARERLAKVAGILIAHPDIKVEVDGYTDSTGDPTFNEQLSQQRAAAVQSYLAQQGVPGSSISIHGFGQGNPVASNETAAGRQQNRRVELVVSGESIGNQVSGGQ